MWRFSRFSLRWSPKFDPFPTGWKSCPHLRLKVQVCRQSVCANSAKNAQPKCLFVSHGEHQSPIHVKKAGKPAPHQSTFSALWDLIVMSGIVRANGTAAPQHKLPASMTSHRLKAFGLRARRNAHRWALEKPCSPGPLAVTPGLPAFMSHLRGGFLWQVRLWSKEEWYITSIYFGICLWYLII